MATKKVIDMIARGTSTLSYDDYLYLTGESPDIDEKMQASVLRDYVLSGIKTSANSGLAQTSTSYASSNPEYELTLDANNLDIATGTISLTDHIVIEAVGSGLTKKMTAANVLAAATSAVTSVNGGDGITVSPTTGAAAVEADLKANGGLVIESGEIAVDLGASSITGTLDNADLTNSSVSYGGVSLSLGGSDATPAFNLSDATAYTGDSSLVTTGTVTSGTWSTGAVIGDATMTLGSDAEGDIYYRDAAGKLKNLAADADGKVMTLASGIPSWAAAGHTTAVEGEGTPTTGVLSTGVTGTAKFLRVDGDDSCSWVVPPDTDTTYSAGDGLDLTGTTFSTDLKTNGGVVIESGELAVDLGASSITGTLANADLTNSSVSYGGVSLSLGGSDATPAFDLADATNYEGSAILSTGETGTAKFLRVDGDNSSSWQVPPDTDTTYTAGDGLDLTGTTFSTDLKTNGGLEIDTTELSVAQGISQHDVAQFDTGVADDDFLRINGTAVEGRSASEVLSDIGAQAALSFGISSGDVTKCGTGIADNDFLRIDGTTTEGRSASEVLSDIAASPVAGSASIVTTGTLTAGFIQGETTGSTGVLSTGEGGGTKFLREDGDGTCSWQAVPAGVTAGFSIAMAVAL